MVDKQKETKIGHLLTALRMANEIVFGEKKLWRRKYFSKICDIERTLREL